MMKKDDDGEFYGYTNVVGTKVWVGSTEDLERIESERHRMTELPGVGHAIGSRLLSKFRRLESLEYASIEEISSIDGISETRAERIKEYVDGQ